MKRILFLFIILLTALAGKPSAAWAQTEIVPGVVVDSAGMERSADYLSATIEMDLSGLQVKRNRAVLLTPRIASETDSVELPSIGIYGRRRYYYYVRGGESFLTGRKDEAILRASKKPSLLDYKQTVAYEAWMNGSVLSLRREDYGCCNTLLSRQEGALAEYAEMFLPEPVYVTPQAEREKAFELEGSAFIDFPVDKTVIYPEYRNNEVELGKIRATIDSVRNDGDTTITSIWLKGYASPESPYSHNTELAKGRTAALKAYVMGLYHFDEALIKTEYEPEDWDGLRRYVESSTLEHRAEILAMIDDNTLQPDAKEWKIKKTYPADYRYLLDNCYPALRHTDYRVAYTVRAYSDIEEIKQLLKTQPQKLSLNEIYLVAQTYEPGTTEFTEVFETAVRLFPDDETANLNAANAAMGRDDLQAAARYLSKAGNSAEAVYARGVLAIRGEDYGEAKTYLQQAADMGLAQAAATLQQLERVGR